MEVSSVPVEWDPSEDREIWFQFLQTKTGRRLIPKVLESCPSLLGHGDTNAILIRSGELRGVQLIVQSLLALSVPEPKVESETPAVEYPPLDDDSRWPDGQKLHDGKR
jgi:hypothetical protein